MKCKLYICMLLHHCVVFLKKKYTNYDDNEDIITIYALIKFLNILKAIN